MKRLAAAADEYLVLRRRLGFKLRHETWWLPDFVAYLEAHGSPVITTELALRWAQQPADGDPAWWAKKLGAIRRFARHHQAFDQRTEVPPADLLPYRLRRQAPYIYTDEEVAGLLRQARRLPDPLMAATYSTILGLLAVTGMRVGEALGLDTNDVDWRHSLVTVRDAKFGKSRHLPLHRSTIAALHAYAEKRDRLRPSHPSSCFFISLAGTRVLHQNFHHVFLQCVRRAGLDRRPQRPRLHDLRHTFAVKTMRDWYRAGVDVERRLPWLSTYLGHRDPTTTYWYLSATPELLALAGRRFERSWKVRP